MAPTVIDPSRWVRGLSTNLISLVVFRNGMITSAVGLIDLTTPRIACVGASVDVLPRAPGAVALAPGDAETPTVSTANIPSEAIVLTG